MAGGGVDVVVAREIERFSRRTDAWLVLRDTAVEHDVELWDFTGPIDVSTANGRFATNVRASTAELYSDLISENIHRVFNERRARGQHVVTGHAPYGFQWVAVGDGNGRMHKELRPDPEQTKLIVRMADLILDDGASLTSVAETFNDEGVRTPRGAGHWRPNTVSPILRHRRLIGRYCDADGADLGPAPWEPIIEPARWTRLQAVLDRRGRFHQQGHDRKTLKRWVRRSAVCGLCGQPITTAGNAARPVYRCPPPRFGGCGRVLAVASGVEATVAEQIIEVFSDPKLRAAIAAAQGEPSIDVAAVTAGLDALEARMADLGSAFANGDVPLDVVTAATGTAETQRRDLRAKLAEAAAETTAPPLPDTLDADTWAAFTGEGKAAVLDVMAERVVIHPAGKNNGPKFDPSRIEVAWHG